MTSYMSQSSPLMSVMNLQNEVCLIVAGALVTFCCICILPVLWEQSWDGRLWLAVRCISWKNGILSEHLLIEVVAVMFYAPSNIRDNAHTEAAL